MTGRGSNLWRSHPQSKEPFFVLSVKKHILSITNRSNYGTGHQKELQKTFYQILHKYLEVKLSDKVSTEEFDRKAGFLSLHPQAAKSTWIDMWKLLNGVEKGMNGLFKKMNSNHSNLPNVWETRGES